MRFTRTDCRVRVKENMAFNYAEPILLVQPALSWDTYPKSQLKSKLHMGGEDVTRKVMEIDLHVESKNQPPSKVLWVWVISWTKIHRKMLSSVLNDLLEVIRFSDFPALR